MTKISYAVYCVLGDSSPVFTGECGLVDFPRIIAQIQPDEYIKAVPVYTEKNI